MDILKELQARKILKAITNEAKFKQIKLGAGVYIGFDPTARSLHLGNYIQIALLLRMKQAGYRALAILGSATGGIGDPSGKQVERKMLDDATLSHNSAKIKKQLTSFGLEVIDNQSFYKDLKLTSFLRQVGKVINVNYMLNKEVVSTRLQSGISFAEFSYQLLQGYDFYNLYKTHNVQIQMGGSDQWGNITTGIELIRKLEGNDNFAVGIITNLMTSSTGKKIGKTNEGAIWIDKQLTSSYQLYQYLLNTSDQDLEIFFNWVTFLPVAAIKAILQVHDQNKSKKHGQKELAKAIISDLHSRQDYEDAVLTTNILFASKPFEKLSVAQINLLKQAIPTSTKSGVDFQDFLVQNKIVSSRREAREAINNKTIYVNGTLIAKVDFSLKVAPLANQVKLIKKGKKFFYLVIN